jgi:hypothetical protein
MLMKDFFQFTALKAGNLLPLVWLSPLKVPSKGREKILFDSQKFLLTTPSFQAAH